MGEKVKIRGFLEEEKKDKIKWFTCRVLCIHAWAARLHDLLPQLQNGCL